MSRARTLVLGAVAVAVVSLSGCQSTAAGSPAPSSLAPADNSTLDGIDATLDQIEHQIDADGAAGS